MALFPYLPKNMNPNRLLSLVLLLTALSAHAKDFIIYDRMDYVGKPDLTADKLSKVFLVYESELVKPIRRANANMAYSTKRASVNWPNNRAEKATAPFLPTSKAGLPKKTANC